MSTQVTGPVISRFKAAADYSAKQYFIMKQSDEDEVTIASAATDLLIGTLTNKPKAGENAAIFGRFGGGTGKVVLGGTVTRGAFLTADSAGKAVATTTVGQEVLGRALNAGDAGDIIEYSPSNQKYAATS